MVSKTDPLMTKSLAYVQRELGAIFNAKNSPFLRPPPKGFARGIDFYSAAQLLQIAARAARLFYSAHGRFPRLRAPKGFNERIMRANLLARRKVPESGNKLLTHTFLPSSLGDELRCARIVWHGQTPRLPSNDEIAPGDYFLKASHGSRMNRHVRYPLADADRTKFEAEAAKWLSQRYGQRTGEWWYSKFDPEILLEEHLGESRFSFNFFCFRGKVALIVLYNQETSEKITLSPEFHLHEHKDGDTPLERICSLSRLAELSRFASVVGAKFDFVRVDLFLTDAGEAILGELTFSPGNGLSKRPEGIDEYLGQCWADVRTR